MPVVTFNGLTLPTGIAVAQVCIFVGLSANEKAQIRWFENWKSIRVHEPLRTMQMGKKKMTIATTTTKGAASANRKILIGRRKKCGAPLIRIVSRIRWIFNSFIFVCGGRTFLLVIVGWKMSSVRVRRFWSVNEATANESNNINRTHSMKMTFRCNTRVEHSTFVVCCWFDVPALHSKCIVY